MKIYLLHIILSLLLAVPAAADTCSQSGTCCGKNGITSHSSMKQMRANHCCCGIGQCSTHKVPVTAVAAGEHSEARRLLSAPALRFSFTIPVRGHLDRPTEPRNLPHLRAYSPSISLFCCVFRC